MQENHSYPLVDLLSIELPERPAENDYSKIFFNPRSLESFTPQEMADLKNSISKDGLQQPLIVRILTDDNTKTGKVQKIQLIAGERRYRTLRSLYQSNELCYNPDTDLKEPAQQLYAKVPCKVYYNISDEKALGLAWIENQKRKDLSIKEEISTIERLIKGGRSVKEVADLLNTNITMVSQFSNFRKELPAEAFEKLINGQLAKHVAVKLLSYNPQDREKLFAATMEAAVENYEETVGKLNFELEELEDTIEMQGENSPKVEVLDKKIKTVKEKLKKVESEKNVVKQGDLLAGASKVNVKPKKGTTETNDLDTQQFYVKLPSSWLKIGKVDPLTKQAVPPDVLEVIIETAKSILAGENDPMRIVHRIMVSTGKWEIHEGMVLDVNFDSPREKQEDSFEEDDES